MFTQQSLERRQRQASVFSTFSCCFRPWVWSCSATRSSRLPLCAMHDGAARENQDGPSDSWPHGLPLSAPRLWKTACQIDKMYTLGIQRQIGRLKPNGLNPRSKSTECFLSAPCGDLAQAIRLALLTWTQSRWLHVDALPPTLVRLRLLLPTPWLGSLPQTLTRRLRANNPRRACAN